MSEAEKQTAWRSEQTKVVCSITGRFCARNADLVGMCGEDADAGEYTRLLKKTSWGEKDAIGGCPIAGEFLLKQTAQNWGGGEVIFLKSLDGEQFRAEQSAKAITIAKGRINNQPTSDSE